MISLKEVTCRFGRTVALRGATLEVGAGESVALWGSNGAGKTTLIRAVLGLVPAASGSITVGGFDARRDGKRARVLVGYVPQELGFYDELRAGQALRFFGGLKGVAAADAEGALARVGLAGHGGKRIRELSGGMKQRLALAIGALGDPPVLILDEVTASLDACGREEFVRLLAGLRGAGRTMLFASHRLEEVGALATRVVTLEKGQITGEHEPMRFAGRLGCDSTLHLAIPAGARGLAVSMLSGAGFEARLNGVGILVPVPASQKAAPFRLLAEARIPVEDFEILGPTPGEERP